ncbi:hypothetical protein Tco_0959600 [Tanacetum coccineum]
MVDDLLSTRNGYATRTALESYSKEFEKKAQEERKLYIDVVEKSVKDIIKDEVKTESLTEFESLENVFLAKSSSQPKSIYEAAESLTEFELKKILLDKMERTYSLKRDHEDKDKDEDLSAGSDRGLKKQKTGKDAKPLKGSKTKESKTRPSKGSKSQPKSSGKFVQAEEPVFEIADTEMPQDQGEKPPLTFDELMSTLIDFSAYVMHNLKIDNLTQEILVGPTFNLLKGTCKSFVELKYHFEECYKAVTDQLDWNNPEGHEYPFDLSKPLPLIEAQGRQVVHADYFFNNDLKYLKGGSSSRKYTTSTTKNKSAKFDNIKGIEDMVLAL